VTAQQLGLTLHPAAEVAVAVGDRVRLRAAAEHSLLAIRAGDTGLVIDVRPSPGPADTSTWNPVVVQLDKELDPRRFYAFEHEELEVLP
jgi:hypothetical protein